MVKGDTDDDLQCDETSGCSTAVANIEETHAVRCCSDVSIQGWTKRILVMFGQKAIYGERART